MAQTNLEFYINIYQYPLPNLTMDKQQQQPEKRFENFQEVFDSENIAIGFTLPGSQFLFKYDVDGGWKDEKGNYYNAKGVLQKVVDGHSDDQEDSPDEEELDQFERMLDDQSGPAKQPKEEKKQQKEAHKQPPKSNEPQSYSSETSKLLQNYKNNQNVREGLPKQLHIFFKMRSKFYQRIKYTVENAQSTNLANVEIKKVKAQAEQQSKKLKQKNKWIEQGGEFDFSGTQLDEATYDRYWYGFIPANPDNYEKIIQQIKKSQEFALLQHKTFYALKSKFYLKKKMQDTIKSLAEPLQAKQDDDLVKIEVDNLPENFPISFILDLCSFSATPLEEIFSIIVVDQFRADILISKAGALKFLNVEGYCHEDKQYVELTVKEDTDKRKLKKTGWFKIGLEAGTYYKTHTRELNDTLALEKSAAEIAKLFTEVEEKQNGGYRLIVGTGSLKKVLMFRGDSLNVYKIQMYVK